MGHQPRPQKPRPRPPAPERKRASDELVAALVKASDPKPRTEHPAPGGTVTAGEVVRCCECAVEFVYAEGDAPDGRPRCPSHRSVVDTDVDVEEARVFVTERGRRAVTARRSLWQRLVAFIDRDREARDRRRKVRARLHWIEKLRLQVCTNGESCPESMRCHCREVEKQIAQYEREVYELGGAKELLYAKARWHREDDLREWYKKHTLAGQALVQLHARPKTSGVEFRKT